MDILIGQLATGLSLGSILLLAALGLSLTFGQMGVINMAHGEFLMAGAYTAYEVQRFAGRQAVVVDMRVEGSPGSAEGHDDADHRKDPNHSDNVGKSGLVLDGSILNITMLNTRNNLISSRVVCPRR